MGYLISAWKETQKKFTMSLKQAVNIAGDGSLENEESINELREFFSMIDLQTMERLLDECYSKDKKYKFDTRGFAFQDLINEMGRRLGYEVENGLYRGKRNEIGFDGLWRSKDGTWIVMESKTNDDYSLSIESVIGYRDKLVIEQKVQKRKCSILLVYGRDEKSALRNTVRGSNESPNIRLISAKALFQLVKIYSQGRTGTIQKQINNLLQPRDYFVLDNLVELVFPQTDPEIPDVDDSDEYITETDMKAVNNIDASIPALPSSSLKIGKFVRQAMETLADSGFVFSDEMMESLLAPTSMHDVVGMQRHMPFFKMYDPKIEKGNYEGDHPRYYSKPLTFGKYTVYLNSQIYDTDREPFVKWYESVTKRS